MRSRKGQDSAVFLIGIFLGIFLGAVLVTWFFALTGAFERESWAEQNDMPEKFEDRNCDQLLKTAKADNEFTLEKRDYAVTLMIAKHCTNIDEVQQ